MGKKNCVICGKEGYSYFPFCYDHLQEKNAGKIVKCDCGAWHYIDRPCQKCEGGGTLTVNRPKSLMSQQRAIQVI